MTALEFHVIGHPQPGGSKRAFPIRRAGALTGRTVVTDSNPRAKDWAALVIAAAFDATHGRRDLPLTGPLALSVEFTLARPARHFGSGRNHDRLRPSAPQLPHIRPDITKLLRPLEDALTGILWRDDAQIVTQLALKNYGTPEGARVKVRTLEPGPAPAAAVDCPRCTRGTWTDSNGVARRCAYCAGTGRAPAERAPP